MHRPTHKNTDEILTWVGLQAAERRIATRAARRAFPWRIRLNLCFLRPTGSPESTKNNIPLWPKSYTLEVWLGLGLGKFCAIGQGKQFSAYHL